MQQGSESVSLGSVVVLFSQSQMQLTRALAIRNALTRPQMRALISSTRVIIMPTETSEAAITSTVSNTESESIKEVKFDTVFDALQNRQLRDADRFYSQLRKSLDSVSSEDLQNLVTKACWLADGSANGDQWRRCLMFAERVYYDLSKMADPEDPSKVFVASHALTTSMLGVYAQLNRTRKLGELVTNIKKAVGTMDLRDYAVIMQGLVRARNPSLALDFFDEVESRLVEQNLPDCRSVYKSLIMVYSQIALRVQVTAETNKKDEVVDAVAARVKLDVLDVLTEKQLPYVRNADQYEDLVQNIMYVHGIMGDASLAKPFEMLKKLVEKNQDQAPKISTYRRLIEIGLFRGNDDLVVTSFEEAEKFRTAEVRLLKKTLAKIAGVYVKRGNIERARELITKHILEREYPNERTKNEEWQSTLPLVKSIFEQDPDFVKIVDEKLQSVMSANTQRESQRRDNQTSTFKQSFVEKRQAIEKLLNKAIEDDNIEEVVAQIKELAKNNSFPGFKLANSAAKVLTDAQNVEGLQKLQSLYKNPPIAVTSRHLQVLAAQGQVNEALSVYNLICGQQYFPNRSTTLSLVECVSKTRPEKALEILRDFESHFNRVAGEDGNKLSQPMADIIPYHTCMTSFLRKGKHADLLKVFERIVSPRNPVIVVPTTATYNLILTSLLKEWNMKKFEDVYERMVANVEKDALAGIPATATPENSRHAKKIELLREAQKEVAPEIPESLIVPSYVVPNRVTHNIRMTMLVSNNRMTECMDLFKSTLPSTTDLTDSESSTASVSQPTRGTYEALVFYFVKSKDLDVSKTKMSVLEVAQKCCDILGDVKVTKESMEDVLKTVENVVDEHMVVKAASGNGEEANRATA